MNFRVLRYKLADSQMKQRPDSKLGLAVLLLLQQFELVWGLAYLVPEKGLYNI